MAKLDYSPMRTRQERDQRVISKSKYILIFLAAAICLVGAIFFVFRVTKSPEPSYQGRSLSSWLEDFSGEGPNTNSPAGIAVRSMGTNAIPFLLDILSYEESPTRKSFRKLAEKSPIPLTFLGKNYMREVEAGYAMNVLGNQTESAFPELTNLFFKGRHSTVAAISLAGMGQKGVHFLLGAITNQNLDVMRFHYAAVNGLGLSHSDAKIIVPALIQILNTNDNSLMRYAAALSLGMLHAKPELSIPALIKSFDDPDQMHRFSVVFALGEFGSEAKPAIPLLLQARKDTDADVRDFAGKILQKISPKSLDEKKSK